MQKIHALLLLLIVSVMFIGCSDDKSTDPVTPQIDDNTPTVSFITPVPGDSIAKSDTMQITIKMKVKQGIIIKVKFLVDGYLNKELTGQSSLTDTLRTFSWPAPDTTGVHSLKIIAQTAGNLEGSASITNIRVVNSSSPASNMVIVNAGTFSMGSITGDEDEQPIHSVTLDSFYIGKYEVTQSEWLAVMGYNPSLTVGELNTPVDQVSWYDILVFCNKISIAEGLIPYYQIKGSTNPAVWGNVPSEVDTSGVYKWNKVICNWSANGYRLPTEAEWEFAARGGNNSHGYIYAGSNLIDDVAWSGENSFSHTFAVGLKAPNELGIYDMSGNVCELIWDYYGSYNSTPQINPTGALDKSNRVTRGGSCRTECYYNRVAARWFASPYEICYDQGFRLARSL